MVTHSQRRGDNGLLTILTSDTMSMLAMSIFIPTPTGGPGTEQNGTDQNNGEQQRHCTSGAACVMHWHLTRKRLIVPA